jgi:hypothetical protein
VVVIHISPIGTISTWTRRELTSCCTKYKATHLTIRWSRRIFSWVSWRNSTETKTVVQCLRLHVLKRRARFKIAESGTCQLFETWSSYPGVEGRRHRARGYAGSRSFRSVPSAFKTDVYNVIVLGLRQNVIRRTCVCDRIVTDQPSVKVTDELL